MSCQICYEFNSDLSTRCCKKVYHEKCWSTWVDKNKTCPTCRCVINKSVSNNTFDDIFSNFSYAAIPMTIIPRYSVIFPSFITYTP